MKGRIGVLQSECERLGWTKTCCICGAQVVCWNNPEPLRDGKNNCCEACNRLVIAARRKLAEKSEEDRAAYIRKVQALTFEELKNELLPS